MPSGWGSAPQSMSAAYGYSSCPWVWVFPNPKEVSGTSKFDLLLTSRKLPKRWTSYAYCWRLLIMHTSDPNLGQPRPHLRAIFLHPSFPCLLQHFRSSNPAERGLLKKQITSHSGQERRKGPKHPKASKYSHPGVDRNMIFERTLTYSLHTPHALYFKMVVSLWDFSGFKVFATSDFRRPMYVLQRYLDPLKTSTGSCLDSFSSSKRWLMCP